MTRKTADQKRQAIWDKHVAHRKAYMATQGHVWEPTTDPYILRASFIEAHEHEAKVIIEASKQRSEYLDASADYGAFLTLHNLSYHYETIVYSPKWSVNHCQVCGIRL